jgi:transmembrane sensor
VQQQVTEPGNRDSTVDEIDAAAQEWFLRLGAGGLSSEEHGRFEAWRDADPRHRAAYEELNSLWFDVGQLEPAFAPQGRARRHVVPPKRQPGRAWWRTGSVVTGLATACLLLFVFGPATSRLPARLLADRSTAAGEQRMVSLPDGSIVWLNTDTAIDISYTGERRRVKLLQGEALFEVQKDAARPFDVVAADGRTTAVGTAFAVKEADGGATVTVTEGIVRVTSPDAVSGSAPVEAGTMVKAGQQVSYRRGEAPGSVHMLDAAAETAWRHGSIVIRGRPLAEALAEIGRYRDGRIVLMGNASRYGAVTARVALADLDGGIDAIAATHGLTVTRVTNYLMIVR